ncbi:carboxypeptidase regulatory-like domain-containing protein [Pedobacter sp. AW31-3R]|uniref:TonB-dependent receptor n=1 Tax=Pedobacter sp. AW31-3R TaxID=3445781 RepID=UPI003FA09A08
MIKNLFFTFMLFFLTCFGRNDLAAQTTQASISGVISDDKSQPIPGASVQVRNESTGFTTSTTTNAKGVYTFKELPLGTPYSVTVKYVGFGDQKRTGYSLNQGDAVRVNISMQDNVQSLSVVEIVGSGMKNKTENFGAATTVSARDIAKLPVNGRNFTSLMDLSPLSRGGSLMGQLGSSTNYTIDGMNAKNPTSGGSTTSRSGAPYSLSMEAVREFKVVTNQYDVTQGRAGGGTISAVTKSGTNTLTGSAFTYGRADWLASRYAINGNKRISDFSTYQYGFSLGGPIIKDKLHFFVAWDHQREARPLQIANIQSSADETRLKLTQSTLDNFVGIAREKYGVSNNKQFGEFDKLRGSDAAFARIDWQINEKNLLTIRDNYTNDRNNLGLEDNTAINLYESYGNDKNVENNLLATLRTSISPRLTNELKAMHLYTYQQSSPGSELPSANIPRAVVEGLESSVGGTTLNTNIQIGGHRFAQEGFENNVFQLVDNLYFNTDKVKYTFGADLMYTRAHSVYGSELNGKFFFGNTQTASGDVVSAIDNFSNLTPYRYTREVPLIADPSVTQGIFNSALYAQMQTKLAKGLEMNAGIRADYTHYPAAPLNQLVYDELGLRTDNSLSTFQFQPRVQFTLDVNEEHRDYVRFGAGIFGSDINNYATINNRVFDGTRIASVDVRTPNVPTPNFPGYRNDPSTSPGVELFDIPGVNKLITINTNASDARVPVVYKANASYNHFFTDKLRAGITGYATLARHNYMYVDRNMVTTPFFTLENEGGRGVYVPASSIKDNSPDWQQGRISNKLGRVLEMNSKGKINQFAVVVDATYQYFKDGEITVSYTWNDTKDNTSYNGNVANTATLSFPVEDDPRDLSKMSYSDNQFRNKIVVYGTLPTFAGFSVGVRYSAISGTRYSLLSGGNTNGDFVSGTNDLAYIFDVNNASVPQNVRTGLQAILDNPNASQSLKDYINKYSGKMAERNGGVNGFYGTVDLRISKKFKIYKTHSIEFSGELFNVANLLNKKWGVNESMGNQSLYSLGTPKTDTAPAQPGFNTTTNQFVYRVNNSGIASPSGNPWQGQFGVRYSF